MSERPTGPLDYPEDIKTVSGLIYWLHVVANDEDCMIDRDAIADICEAAYKRMESMHQSLIQEVDRIERLQPFFTKVCAAVDAARKPSA